MCGIIGFIGKSKNPRATCELTSELLKKTETRGFDATGFWGAEAGQKGAIYYDKCPIKSTEYIGSEAWKKYSKIEHNLFIGHCRASSINGSEKQNRNNHPHCSNDRRIAMVHNGKISEYHALKARYDHTTECYSEILLRMFEHSETSTEENSMKKSYPAMPSRIAYRMFGVKEIFSRINFDHAMAVAIAERHDDGSRSLWLFRDEKRPLCIIDLMDVLGQVFFCSTPEIFRAAYEDAPLAKSLIPQDQPVIEFPSMQVWYMGLDPLTKFDFKKYAINKKKSYDYVDDNKNVNKQLSKVKKPKIKVVTRLNDKDEIINTIAKKKTTHTQSATHTPAHGTNKPKRQGAFTGPGNESKKKR